MKVLIPEKLEKKLQERLDELKGTALDEIFPLRRKNPSEYEKQKSAIDAQTVNDMVVSVIRSTLKSDAINAVKRRKEEEARLEIEQLNKDLDE